MIDQSKRFNVFPSTPHVMECKVLISDALQTVVKIAAQKKVKIHLDERVKPGK